MTTRSFNVLCDNCSKELNIVAEKTHIHNGFDTDADGDYIPAMDKSEAFVLVVERCDCEDSSIRTDERAKHAKKR